MAAPVILKLSVIINWNDNSKCTQICWFAFWFEFERHSIFFDHCFINHKILVGYCRKYGSEKKESSVSIKKGKKNNVPRHFFVSEIIKISANFHTLKINFMGIGKDLGTLVFPFNIARRHLILVDLFHHQL